MSRARTSIGGSSSSASTSSKAKAPSSGFADMDRAKLIKIIAASIIGLAAILLLLVNTGILDFSTPPKPEADFRSTLPPEQQIQFDKEQKARETLDKIRPPAGA